jgi:drug/metabolite transporter (DMT)-like permease
MHRLRMTRGTAVALLILAWCVSATALLNSSAPAWAWIGAGAVYVAACVVARRLPRDDAVPAGVRAQSIRVAAGVVVVLALVPLALALMGAIEFAGAWPVALIVVFLGAFNLRLMTRDGAWRS